MPIYIEDIIERALEPAFGKALEQAVQNKAEALFERTFGKRCRDTFLSLKSTCKKLGVRFMSYLRDRITKVGKILSLPELVRKKAGPAPI